MPRETAATTSGGTRKIGGCIASVAAQVRNAVCAVCRQRVREMPVRDEKEHLNLILGSHLTTIHDTLQILDQTPSSLDKVTWDDVIKMGDQVSKQATTVGMLWTGDKPESKVIEENMASYINTLQGFLLLSHGSTVGAGPTLSSCIHASVKLIVDSSFRLMKETVSLYGDITIWKQSSSHGVISHLQLKRLGTTWHASGWMATIKEVVRLV